MRVAHIITGLAEDGAEKMLLKLLRCMERPRFESVVVSLTKGGALTPQIEELGIPVWRFGLRSLRDLLKWRPDLLQGWMYHGNLAAQLVAALSPWSPPVIWNIRGSHSDLREEKPSTALAIWLGAKLSRLPRKIVNNSELSAQLHEQGLNFAPDRWAIIPNGFDLSKFFPSPEARHEVRAELSIPEHAPLIGLVGRWHPMKDHANFLRAAGLLSTQMAQPGSPDPYYLLAGQGADPANTTLGAQIRGAGIEGRVRLLGPRIDIARVLAALDIATSASYSEGFPNVIGEAMCCGIPCVVTDVGASASLVGEAGSVTPPRNPEALATAWRDLIDRGPEQRRHLGQLARQRVATHFSMASVAKRYEDLYRWALEPQIADAPEGNRCSAVSPSAVSSGEPVGQKR